MAELAKDCKSKEDPSKKYCPYCGRGYSNLGNVNKHIKKDHQNQQIIGRNSVRYKPEPVNHTTPKTSNLGFNFNYDPSKIIAPHATNSGVPIVPAPTGLPTSFPLPLPSNIGLLNTSCSTNINGNSNIITNFNTNIPATNANVNANTINTANTMNIANINNNNFNNIFPPHLGSIPLAILPFLQKMSCLNVPQLNSVGAGLPFPPYLPLPNISKDLQQNSDLDLLTSSLNLANNNLQGDIIDYQPVQKKPRLDSCVEIGDACAAFPNNDCIPYTGCNYELELFNTVCDARLDVTSNCPNTEQLQKGATNVQDFLDSFLLSPNTLNTPNTGNSTKLPCFDDAIPDCDTANNISELINFVESCDSHVFEGANACDLDLMNAFFPQLGFFTNQKPIQ